MEKKRRNLFGSRKVVEFQEYTDHLKEFSEGLGCCHGGTRYDESETLDGCVVVRRPTLEFDDDVTSKIDYASLFDYLDNQEELEAIQDHRYINIEVDKPGLTDAQKKRAENIVGKKRRIPISRSEYEDYHDHMKETSWNLEDPDVIAKIQRDWKKVREFKTVRVVNNQKSQNIYSCADTDAEMPKSGIKPNENQTTHHHHLSKQVVFF